MLSKLMKFSFLNNIVFSLDGPTASINDAIRGKKVFDTLLSRIKLTECFKNNYGRADIDIQINYVISALNLHYTLDMLKLCNTLPVSRLSLLMIEETGNAAGKGYGISSDETVGLIRAISEHITKHPVKYKILPKFTTPLAREYAKEVLGLDFPTTTIGCGAGTTFAFVNNKGELFPCNRCLNVLGGHERSLLHADFWDIWSQSEFNEPFDMSESFSTYCDVSPCNRCSHLQKDCFPCYKTMRKTMPTCQLFMNAIELCKEGIQ